MRIGCLYFWLLAVLQPPPSDRKSTRLNSSHLVISYAVFCLKKKKSPLHFPPVADSEVRAGHDQLLPLLVHLVVGAAVAPVNALGRDGATGSVRLGLACLVQR